MTVSQAWMVYLAATVIGELLLPFAPIATALVDAAVLVSTLSQFGWAQRFPLAIGDPPTRVLPAIALLPLLRLLSLTMPVPDLPPLAWIALVGAPFLVAIWAAARLMNLDIGELSLSHLSRDWRTLIVVCLSPLAGLLLARVTGEPLWATSDPPLRTAAVAFVVVAFAAIPEELAFRGMLQPLIGSLIGRMTIVTTAAVYGLTYSGTRSLAAVALMAAVGLVYGWEVDRTEAIWGPIVGHGLLLAAATFAAPMLAA